MMKKTLFILMATLMASSVIGADKGLSRSQYITKWKDEAIRQMAMHKIPASITLAQGIVESGNGNSELASKSNNHFGIKCHSDWKGKKTYHDDDKKGECFRKYNSAEDSFNDHSDFLKKNRYASLFDLDITDYKGWAKGLKKCGYATSPKYAKMLIDIIEQNDLDKYDKEGIKAMRDGDFDSRPKKEEPIVDDYDDELPSVDLTAKRHIKLSKNNIKFVLAENGDNFESVASDLDLMPWQIWKYNDLKKTDSLDEGQLVYIQPKRGRCKTKTHTVTAGETMWDVSQRYGVKMNKIYKRNSLTPGSPLTEGMTLNLNSSKR
jgi:hypothetical protein